MADKKVLVTGASGYIGGAVARAFRRAGWSTYGLVRDRKYAVTLARDEIRPVVASLDDVSSLQPLAETKFEVIVSNTDDPRNPGAHFEQVRDMLAQITRQRTSTSTRPLVLFTSGSKDYGEMVERHGDRALSPHTEGSPITPHPFAAARANFASSLLRDPNEHFDVTVLRPVLVYGYSSGLYGLFFDLAAKSSEVLELKADPQTILHSVHVDDCAEAYVALAEYGKRAEIIGKGFNVSNARYETVLEVGTALAKSYDLSLKFADPPAQILSLDANAVANSSQWVSSDLIRALTGWRERRPMFTAGIDDYRLAFEAFTTEAKID